MKATLPLNIYEIKLPLNGMTARFLVESANELRALAVARSLLANSKADVECVMKSAELRRVEIFRDVEDEIAAENWKAAISVANDATPTLAEAYEKAATCQ
jgi:hypothetical protein